MLTAYDSAQATNNAAGGAANVFTRFAQTTVSSTVTGTTNETYFDRTLTVPANTLIPGTTLKIAAVATQIAENGTDTAVFGIKVATNPAAAPTITGLAIIDSTAQQFTAGAYAILLGELVVRTAGGGGTCYSYGTCQYALAGSGQRAAAASLINSGSASLDTTVDQTVGVTAKFSSGSAGNQAALNMLSILTA